MDSLNKVLKGLSCLILAVMVFAGCSNNTAMDDIELSISYNLNAVVTQKPGIKNIEVQSKGAENVVGKITVINNNTSESIIYDWYGRMDESLFSITSSIGLVISPGVYDFILDFETSTSHYVGECLKKTIIDGDNSVQITISPVIGAVSNSFAVEQRAKLRFQYSAYELSKIAVPKLALTLTPTFEPIVPVNALITFNKDNGHGDSFIYLAPGDYLVDAALLDDSTQVGKSEHSVISVNLAESVDLDLVPLHGEIFFDIGFTGGNAVFTFDIPQEVITEAGSVDNLETRFQLSSGVNGAKDMVIGIEQNGSNYQGQVVLPDFYYDTIDLAITFTDIAEKEVIGTGLISNVVLNKNIIILEWPLTVDRRAYVSGNLKAALGLNVFDPLNNPVAGATVYANGKMVGITGGTAGLEGYLKVFLAADSYTIDATIADGRYGTISLSLEPMEVANRIITLDASQQIVLTDFQSIQTSAVNKGKSFTIGTDTYLGMASLFDGTKAAPVGSGSDRNSQSKILKWNGSAFEEYQSIPTIGAFGMEFMTIGTDHFMAVPFYYNNYTYSLDSKIYKWDGSAFVDFQSIPTNGARDFHAFSIGEDHYLAVANSRNETSHAFNVKIYKWDGIKFAEFQTISGHGIARVKTSVIDGETYLAFSNLTNGTDFNLDVQIYKWSTDRFIQHQAIPSSGASMINFSTVNGKTLLFVPNYYNNTSYINDSKIYEWNGAEFVYLQSIPTKGAFELQPFFAGNSTYMATVNYIDDSNNYNQLSTIYKWNGTGFVSTDITIPTMGGMDCEPIKVGPQTFLAFSNYGYGAGGNLMQTSKIYRVDWE